MENGKLKIEALKIVGIAVRTTNENNQAMQDIGQLWQRLMSENIPAQISNRLSDDIYSLYFDYESDHTGPYTNMLGFLVDSLDNIPTGLIGKEVPAQKMQVFTAKGKVPMSIYTTWQQIWADESLNRAFAIDYEIMTEKSQGENAEVDIFISVK